MNRESTAGRTRRRGAGSLPRVVTESASPGRCRSCRLAARPRPERARPPRRSGSTCSRRERARGTPTCARPRFAWDAYRRFISMFGRIVLGIAGEKFEHPLEARKKKAGAKIDADLTPDALRELVAEYKDIVRRETKKDFPTEPRDQMRLAIEAVFQSWFGKRAVDYRNQFKIRHDLGTAVSVVTMVFGNMGNDSGTGVAFTRDPNTGAKEIYGEFLPNAQGEDVVAGIRTPKKISEMRDVWPAVYRQFEDIAARLEQTYRDVQDLEFTVERGKLYMLQTRNAKRTGKAAVLTAVQMVAEALSSKDEALRRIQPMHSQQIPVPQFDPDSRNKAGAPLGKGLAASPGP